MIVLPLGLILLGGLRLLSTTAWDAKSVLTVRLARYGTQRKKSYTHRAREWAWNPMRMGVGFAILRLLVRCCAYTEFDVTLGLTRLETIPALIAATTRTLIRKVRRGRGTQKEPEEGVELEASLVGEEAGGEYEQAALAAVDDMKIRQCLVLLTPTIMAGAILVAGLILGLSKYLAPLRHPDETSLLLGKADLFGYLVVAIGAVLQTFGARMASGGFFEHLAVGCPDLRWTSLLAAPVTLIASAATLLCYEHCIA